MVAIARGLAPLLMRPWMGKCTGTENIPVSGAILAANHASYMDHFIIGSVLVKHTKRDIRYLAKKEHFRKGLEGWWHRYLKAIPVDREAGGREGLEKAVECLKKGDLIMIYPEGTRTLTGEMNRAKTGVARLALAAEVPVVPIGITNTFNILPKGKKVPKKGKADVRIGKPLYFRQYYGKENDRDTLRKMTTMIMKEIARLSGQEYAFDEEYR